MANTEVHEFTNVEKLKFTGGGVVEIDNNGNITGIDRYSKSGKTLIFTCGSGDGNSVTFVGDGFTSTVTGGSVSFGNSFSSFSSGGGMSVTDNEVRWGSNLSAKKTSFGLKINMPTVGEIELNGRRFRVSSLLSGSSSTPVPAGPPEKKKEYRVVGGEVNHVQSEGNCRVRVARFPYLAKRKLTVETHGNSSIKFEADFAIDDLVATSQGNSTISAEDMIASRTATLASHGNSTIKNVVSVGPMTANSYGNSSLHASVADKNQADHSNRGNSRCSISRLDDESILEATKALSKLTEPTPESRPAEAKKEPEAKAVEVKAEGEEEGDGEKEEGTAKKRKTK